MPSMCPRVGSEGMPPQYIESDVCAIERVRGREKPLSAGVNRQPTGVARDRGPIGETTAHRFVHTALTSKHMDWSLLHALNNFLASHDAIEDPVVAYERAAQFLFVALIAGLFLIPRGAIRS